ncbi:hypothetical protein V1293_004686 [Bradyrhizobium sp. AZCC 1693]
MHFLRTGFWRFQPTRAETSGNLLIYLPLCRHGQSNQQVRSARNQIGFRGKGEVCRGRRGSRRSRRAATARGDRARPEDVAGGGRGGAQGLSADAVLDQRARLLGREWRPAGMAVYDRAVAPDRRPRRLSIRHQCLEPRDLRRHREARFRHRVLSRRGVLPTGDLQRAARRGAGVRPHGHPAPLARLADQCGDIALAGQWPLLSAQPRRRRSQEPGVSHRRGFAHRHRLAGRFRRRRHLGIPVGRHLHCRAVDHRRRADGDAGRLDPHHPPAFS